MDPQKATRVAKRLMKEARLYGTAVKMNPQIDAKMDEVVFPQVEVLVGSGLYTDQVKAILNVAGDNGLDVMIYGTYGGAAILLKDKAA